jgi:hypothetical protein
MKNMGYVAHVEIIAIKETYNKSARIYLVHEAYIT